MENAESTKIYICRPKEARRAARRVKEKVISLDCLVPFYADHMKLVAFKPQGIIAPERVLYAMVPPGEVTMDLWLDCIAHRVQMMLDRKKWFKRTYANKICKILHFPPCDDLDKFGQYIVGYKSFFKKQIKNSITKGMIPFPIIVIEQDEQVFEDMQADNLENWAGLTHLVISGILLNDSDRFMDYSINKEYFSNKAPFRKD